MLESGIGRAHNIHLSTLPNFSLPGDVAASRRYFAPDLIDPEIDGAARRHDRRAGRARASACTSCADRVAAAHRRTHGVARLTTDAWHSGTAIRTRDRSLARSSCADALRARRRRPSCPTRRRCRCSRRWRGSSGSRTSACCDRAAGAAAAAAAGRRQEAGAGRHAAAAVVAPDLARARQRRARRACAAAPRSRSAASV